MATACVHCGILSPATQSRCYPTESGNTITHSFTVVIPVVPATAPLGNSCLRWNFILHLIRIDCASIVVLVVIALPSKSQIYWLNCTFPYLIRTMYQYYVMVFKLLYCILLVYVLYSRCLLLYRYLFL